MARAYSRQTSGNLAVSRKAYLPFVYKEGDVQKDNKRFDRIRNRVPKTTPLGVTQATANDNINSVSALRAREVRKCATTVRVSQIAPFTRY